MSTEWGYGVGREIIWFLMETFVCRYHWIWSPRMQVIIRYVGLWQDAVPNLEWHSGVGRKEAYNIVVPKRADDSLGDVGSFVIWRHIPDGDFG